MENINIDIFDYFTLNLLLDDDVDEVSELSWKPQDQYCQPNHQKRKYNPDTDAIAEETNRELVDQGIDPRSKDGKLMRRQIRNRVSAQYHRDRKNEQINIMENIICNLRNENARLVSENEDLRKLSGNTGDTIAVAGASVDPSVPHDHIFFSTAYPHYANNSISCSESCSWSSNDVYPHTDTEEQEKDITEDFILNLTKNRQQQQQS